MDYDKYSRDHNEYTPDGGGLYSHQFHLKKVAGQLRYSQRGIWNWLHHLSLMDEFDELNIQSSNIRRD
jgi:hypothetical protein